VSAARKYQPGGLPRCLRLRSRKATAQETNGCGPDPQSFDQVEQQKI
jgi:hypothetical protein